MHTPTQSYDTYTHTKTMYNNKMNVCLIVLSLQDYNLILNQNEGLRAGKLISEWRLWHTTGCLSFASAAEVVSPHWRTAGPAQRSCCQGHGCTARCCCRISVGRSEMSWMEPPAGCWTDWGDLHTVGSKANSKSVHSDKTQWACNWELTICTIYWPYTLKYLTLFNQKLWPTLLKYSLPNLSNWHHQRKNAIPEWKNIFRIWLKITMTMFNVSCLMANQITAFLT